MPDYQKAAGIGDSVDGFLGPGTYDRTEKPGKKAKERMLIQINKQIAVNDWHKRLFEKEKQKSPEKYADHKAKVPSPGPGHYTTGRSPLATRTFHRPNQAAFGSNEAKKIHEVDRVQLP